MSVLVTLGELRLIINEAIDGVYTSSLVDDDSLKHKSTYVPYSKKRSTKRWMSSMGLARRKKKKRDT